ncbi:Phenolic glucoside malonyltransferase [Actinidia chinensis var. chinensis]|uniref:Phenolic glucoside malonyltransferase n=1 Tax=Actinidia chinensis var. chinensis TaxID=1590841 RepID=A0A2R6RKG1_ACTCC|nr:Phenolic glucoside malonyltransferase [Actinidia chinensis var. chinensis]
MATPNPVNVLELCKVAPTPPSPDSTVPTSLPITFFDTLLLRFCPTQRLFFYESPHSTTTFLEIVVPKLKHSLSFALQHYLPLAGNVTWAPDYSKPIIDYVEGNAVSFTVAESEADFYLLSGDNFRDSQYFNPFLPCLVDTETRVPVLALQVTLFPNVGFSIGYAVHHGVLDGKTTTMFMHSWAFLCAHDGDSTLTPELTPFYDRTMIIDPSNLQTTYLNFWLGKDAPNNKSLSLWDLKAPPDTMLGTFILTQANIENIKKWVQFQWEKKQLQNQFVHVSSFVITTAYTWVCLVKARQIRGGKVYLAINVDCRSRLKPLIPPTYFGNCITSCNANANSDELTGDDGIAIAVMAIGEAIQGLKDGVLKGKEDLLSRAISIPPARLFSIAGSPRFEFYKTNFGWGRPRKVETTSIDKTGAFSLSDSRDGNSEIEIGIVLKKHESEKMVTMQDLDFMDCCL